MFLATFVPFHYMVVSGYREKIARSFSLVSLIVANITSIGTFLSMSLGMYISKLLPHPVANALGAGVIVMLGGV